MTTPERVALSTGARDILEQLGSKDGVPAFAEETFARLCRELATQEREGRSELAQELLGVGVELKLNGAELAAQQLTQLAALVLVPKPAAKPAAGKVADSFDR